MSGVVNPILFYKNALCADDLVVILAQTTDKIFLSLIESISFRLLANLANAPIIPAKTSPCPPHLLRLPSIAT